MRRPYLILLDGRTLAQPALNFLSSANAEKDTLGKESGDEEQFFWRTEGALVMQPPGLSWQQEEPGVDHAEAIT